MVFYFSTAKITATYLLFIAVNGGYCYVDTSILDL